VAPPPWKRILLRCTGSSTEGTPVPSPSRGRRRRRERMTPGLDLLQTVFLVRRKVN